MKLLLTLLLPLLASSFSPTLPSTAGTALSAKAEGAVFDDYVGNSDWAGKPTNFDPLGLSAKYPAFVPWFR